MNSRQTRILNRFEKAAINLSWIGAQPPQDHDAIRKEYRRARAELVRVIGEK